MDERPTTPWTSAAAPHATARPAVAETRPAIHVLLLAVTVLTTTVAGARWEGIDPTTDLRLLARGVPFAATLIGILLVHEMGHYLMCLRHRVSASLPYFLPAPPQIFPLGTFGAFIRIRSRFPDRRALFDIGAAGPWAGFVVALAATVYGLAHSTVLPAAPAGPAIEFGDSLLTSFLTWAVLGVDSATVQLHPVGFAGWFGLFVTSLNLLPAGQLDGGHVLYAATGRRTLFVPALLIGGLAWLGVTGWPGWLLWAAILGLLLTLGHPPTGNDHAPLGLRRQLASLATLALLVLTFVPDPIRIIE